jgi:heme A synthase
MYLRKPRLMATFGIALLLSLACKSAADAQLQPVTTTVLCNSVPTCTAAQLPNVNAATLRRAAGDVLGRSHIAVLIMHPHSGYTSFAALCWVDSARFYDSLHQWAV